MKYLLTTALIILSICPTQAQTTFYGSIYADTTLTKANSPYIMGHNTVFFQGTTLTIEPGVTVYFAPGVEISLRGRLVAKGTATDSIHFTIGPAYPGQKYTGFRLQQDSTTHSKHIDMQYCVVENASAFLNMDIPPSGPVRISNCNFRNNATALYDIPYYSDSVLVSNTTFYNNVRCINGGSTNPRLQFTNCKVLNNNKGLEGGIIDNCYFEGNYNYGAKLGKGITNSIFYNNHIAVDARNTNATFENNEVIYNKLGVEIYYYTIANGTFKNNLVCHNELNLRHHSPQDVKITENCWCSNDSMAVRNLIRDGYVENSLGLVEFTYNLDCSPSKSPPTTTVQDLDNHATPTLQLYPNPFNNSATISFDNKVGAAYTLSVIDMTGRVVKTIGNITTGKATINREGLTAGIYLLRLEGASEVMYGKATIR